MCNKLPNDTLLRVEVESNLPDTILLVEVESDLPDDIRDDALRVFRIAVDSKCTIKVRKSASIQK